MARTAVSKSAWVVLGFTAFVQGAVAFTISTLVFEDNFESHAVGSGPKDIATATWGKCSGNCPTVTTERSRKGSKAIKAYLSHFGSETSYRTELVPRGVIRDGLKAGDELWYGISIFIPTTHMPDDRSNDIVAQWHHGISTQNCSKGGGNPPIKLDVMNKIMRLTVRSSPGIVNDCIGTVTAKTYSLGEYKTGVWQDFAFHIRWAYLPSHNGILEVYRNGQLILTHKGPNNYANGDGASWLKFGLYKTAWRSQNNDNLKRYDPRITTRTFYFDEFRVARGAQARLVDVSP